jgi:glycine/D-amino acid oxidase-like deaminating enzyme
MPGYGARYWTERTAVAKRRRYPVLRGDHSADVVIIGGGLTGATAAYVLAKGGLDVILVDADRLASAGTAASLGCLMPEPHVSFRSVEAAIGLRRARAAWQATRASALEMAALLRRLSVRCDLLPSPAVTTAMTDEGCALLRREYVARNAAGLEASWLSPTVAASTVGSSSSGAIKFRGGAVFDPVRAAGGIVRAAEEAGARVFEKSLVRRTTFSRRAAEVVLRNGRIQTKGVFVATGAPGSLFRPLGRHVRQSEGYVVVTEPLSSGMKREIGRRDSVVVELGPSERCLRWLDDGRAMFGGAASTPAGTRKATRVLVQRTGQLMYELSLRHPVISGLPGRWSWPIPVVTGPDGLPWIGAHRNYPFHFFAVAFGWHGDGLAWFAAKAALRHFTDQAERADDTFGFGR